MSAGKRLDTLAMTCPACGQTQVPPLVGSTLTIAWYTCTCGHFWSARVRDGRPVGGVIPQLPEPPAIR
jgi:transcription elongation factor Elf1